ncbi:exopolysaccharide biosynthesis polyprenyl glycosylphosphotransferase [Rhodoblastus acidophilus]|uniref:Exopolysaccharide biosynthesis polyprenyl glycosylphosphotransferase n=1 Tax=Candidatus Rhodoblastus alkanivorans TaxID=2954117 RepID=A0ABS9Z9P9_9HYPH|nr:exopolysaccharide biosynthesis polyprenyl glycosylphosphotransferase [Candidatus Rhodoblastus alkanivorans]MCI4677065.1 exopolysaccharide biosynthesis polyprenyl glycosylphosphotransferase [Candidatus Rhodoblastus alkanivorans]MCI4684418.1 exopolysaccharide biosynthesis polyprenyl glycosylphosphotransferase [Candidatus Rhodoblastus alkanivorans]MDI4641739.1 exopolysaccharide biosynthesis polyprenyl glycosylphosphotransferase [Rhodoblastus acidophilus]
MNAHNRMIVAARAESAAPRDAPHPRKRRKWPIRHQAVAPLVALADVAAILVASVLAALAAPIESGVVDFGKALGSTILVSALFVSLQQIRDKYRPAELLALRNQLRAVALAWASVFILLAAVVAASDIGGHMPRGAGLFAALSLFMLTAVRILAKRLLAIGIGGRRFAGHKALLLTDQPKRSAVDSDQTLATLGFSVAQSFVLPPPDAGSGERKRFSARVIDYVQGSDVEEIVIDADPKSWRQLRSFLGDLRVLPLPILFVPIGAPADFFRRPTRDLGGALCVELQPSPLAEAEHAAKRALDLIGAGLALVLLAPLLVAAAIAIKLDSPGPVLFRQQRCGFNGRSFTIRKFRTMSVLEDGPTVVQARQDDQRVTRVGKWLRRTSIDELPQLFNVIGGSMCLVGPRPHALAHDNEFDKLVRNYAFRRRVKPGLTGWAQIHGCRGPTPNAAAVERRVEYDLWYVDNWSLRLDMVILLKTPFELLRGRNAF